MQGIWSASLSTRRLTRSVLTAFFVLQIATVNAIGQTTEFTFQGVLNDGPQPANGSYDFEFRLFGVVPGSPPFGTIQRLAVPVTNGSFNTKLDFGQLFSGIDRFIEIAMRPAGGGAFTTLAPRQKISSSPYSIRSLISTNAEQLAGIEAAQYVLTTDPRMTDARPPTANSSNYVQNALTPQSANFNITGTGTVGGTMSGNIVNAATQYRLGNERILAAGGENLFAGLGAGTANVGGIENAYFGRFAGENNAAGSGNTFVGFIAGRSNNGSNNSYFGSRVGFNGGGDFNSLFGHRSGENNFGSVNSFFGTGSGLSNSTGNSNTFLGHDAGNANTSGSFNTVLGENSDVGSSALTNATAIGSKALVTQSNSLVLGSIIGTNGATAGTDVGIGTTAPASRLHINGTGVVRARINSDSNAGVALALNGALRWSVASTSPGHLQFFNESTAQQAAWFSISDNSLNVGAFNVGGIATLASLGNAGSTALCRNASNQISICSSSMRYKAHVNSFGQGIGVIKRLRPVSFDWKDGGMHDLGLVAEEVAEVEPLLTTTNARGEVEGVKYDRVGVVLVNAVTEQQAEIESQKKEIAALRDQVDVLRKLVCATNATADLCKRDEK